MTKKKSARPTSASPGRDHAGHRPRVRSGTWRIFRAQNLLFYAGILVSLCALVFLVVVLVTQGVQKASLWASVLIGGGLALVIALVKLVMWWREQRTTAGPSAQMAQTAQGSQEAEQEQQDPEVQNRSLEQTRRRLPNGLHTPLLRHLGAVGAIIVVLGAMVWGIWAVVTAGTVKPSSSPSVISSAPSTPTVGGQCASPPGPVAVAVSGRANSAALELPGQVRDVVQRVNTGVPVFVSGPTLSLVELDGRPHVLATHRFWSTARNDLALDQDRAEFLNSFAAKVSAVRAEAAEVDVLAGMDEAARAARPTPGGSGTIAVIDSFLSTTGPLDFSAPNIIDADTNQVVNFLQATGALPDLSGLTVILAFRDVAPPQLPLNPARRHHLVELWTKIAQAGKPACVEVVNVPGGGPAPTAVPPVKTVPIPPPPQFVAAAPTPAVLPDDDTVGFLPGTAVFRNPAAARKVLEPLAHWLVGDRTHHVQLTGTTARVGSEEMQKQLALRRAESVKKALIELGADPSQIATAGAGSYFPQYIPDNDASGLILPGPAQANRTVRVNPS